MLAVEVGALVLAISVLCIALWLGPRREASPATSSVPARILVVECQSARRSRIEQELRGFDLVHASSAAQGIARARADRSIVGIVVNYALEAEHEGVELCKTLLRERPERFRILISGETRPGLARALETAGIVTAHVSAPWPVGKLEARVRRAVAATGG